MIFMTEKLYPKFKDKGIVIILFSKLLVASKILRLKFSGILIRIPWG